MADTPGRVPMPEGCTDGDYNWIVWCLTRAAGRFVVVYDKSIGDPVFLRKMADALVAGAAWVEDGQRAASKGGAE